MKETLTRTEENRPDTTQVPEIEIYGDEAIIRVRGPEQLEERKVKLPKTTWA